MRTLLGHDREVAQWGFWKGHVRPVQYNMAVGILTDEGQMIGSVIFSGFNGSDAEVHYYGPNSLTRRVLKEIAVIALKVLRVNRLTIKTRFEDVARGVKKLGAAHEATMPYYYGDHEDDVAEQFAFFRPQMERFTGLEQ